jgi:hypothetical protein
VDKVLSVLVFLPVLWGFSLSVLLPKRTITLYILLSSHTDDIQGDSGERVHICGGDSIDHCEKKKFI